MADKSVYLYQTLELETTMDYEYGDGERALKRAKTYIEGAFSQINLDVGVTIKSETPNPPQEGYKNVEGPYPCYDFPGGSWNWLNGWFRDWLSCKNLQPGHEEHDDVSFLLSNTNETDGGLSFRRCAHAQTGYYVGKLPSYYTGGSGKAFSAMDTVLHELGHSFMQDTEISYEHNSGVTDETASSATEFSKTPMGFRTDESSNECNDDHHYKTGSSIGTTDVYFPLKWSQCCLDKWSPNAYQL